MRVDDLVEYQTDVASSGIGRVIAYDVETETVTVRDVDDGSTWVGPEDKTSLAQNQVAENTGRQQLG